MAVRRWRGMSLSLDRGLFDRHVGDVSSFESVQVLIDDLIEKVEIYLHMSYHTVHASLQCYQPRTRSVSPMSPALNWNH